MRSSAIRKRATAAAVITAALALAAGPARAGTVTFTFDAATLQSLLRAVTPYDVVVGKHGLSETLTLSNPRDVRFANGRVTLRLDCRGTPLPIETVIEPEMTIRWNEVRKGFEARIERLPLDLPVIGSIDLAEYLKPFTIPSVFSQPAGDGDEALAVEGKITSLRVLDTMIQASADIAFRRAKPPAATPPAATNASNRQPGRP